MKNRPFSLLTESGNEKYTYPLYIIAIIFLIAIITYVIYITGGTSSAVQLLYIPIFMSLFVFGINGGIAAAVVTGIAVGPFMPKDVATHMMQPPIMWMLRILISIVIVLIVGALSERIKKTDKLEKKKVFEDINTGYFNSNKFKLDLETLINTEKCSNISMILFDLENLDMIKRYVNFGISQKSYFELLHMSKQFFSMGTIYNISSRTFCVLLLEYSCEETFIMAKKFISNTTNPIYVDGFPISLVVKGGIVSYPFHDSDSDEIIIKLDKALDQASRSHHYVVIYNSKLEEEQDKYYCNLVSLYHALKSDMFTLAYQPKIDIKNNKVEGVEALLRWNDKSHNNMSISELIKRAEDAGFINQITKWVIINVVEQQKQWKEKGIDTTVSINLSSRDLTDMSFVTNVINYITANEINPESIEFELTERSIIHDENKAMEEIKKLKDFGIKIALDDYGTGFNSIKYLVEFSAAFDYLKIDKLFIDKILNEENFKIVECIINASHKLGMKVISEGVETKEQADILKTTACDMIQGYYYSKPLMPYELEQFIINYK